MRLVGLVEPESTIISSLGDGDLGSNPSGSAISVGLMINNEATQRAYNRKERLMGSMQIIDGN